MQVEVIRSARPVRTVSALAKLPGWMLDYVIVHELAHLAVPAHYRSSWALVGRYPKAERAVGANAELD